eukprot:gnl/Trimastix_PCT/2401.p1 GENE.gnl/Trimastix_PCT/2401~~gnl/Trimastix_PCT/2401.p1  ORF type:complete len:231 (-),score=52.91 gnl/Trimastix_PCT/2401:252-944(-)
MPKVKSQRVKLHRQADETAPELVDAAHLSKEQKRKAKRQAFLNRLDAASALKLKQEKDKKEGIALTNDNALLMALEEAHTMDLSRAEKKQREILARAKCQTRRSRQRVFNAELQQMYTVLSHPNYQENALSALHQHLSRTLPANPFTIPQGGVTLPAAPAPDAAVALPPTTTGTAKAAPKTAQHLVSATLAPYQESPLASLAFGQKGAHSAGSKRPAGKGKGAKRRGKRR